MKLLLTAEGPYRCGNKQDEKRQFLTNARSSSNENYAITPIDKPYISIVRQANELILRINAPL